MQIILIFRRPAQRQECIKNQNDLRNKKLFENIY